MERWPRSGQDERLTVAYARIDERRAEADAVRLAGRARRDRAPTRPELLVALGRMLIRLGQALSDEGQGVRVEA